MSKKKAFRRKIQTAADKLFSEGSLWGFDFDDITVKGRRILARGEYEDAGVEAELDMIVEFNKRGALKKITTAADYDDFDASLVQGWEFSNYKKFEKAFMKNRHASKYNTALKLIEKGTEIGYQKGVDLMEKIPGVGDVWISFAAAELPDFYVT